MDPGTPMSGTRARGQQRRSVVISAALHPDEYDQLVRETERLGTNRARFIRRAVLAELERLVEGRRATRKRKGVTK